MHAQQNSVMVAAGFVSRYLLWAWAALCFVAGGFCQSVAEEPAVLTRSLHSSAQSIPLILSQSATGKMVSGWIKIKCESPSESESGQEAPFAIETAVTNATSDLFLSQLWISAVVSGSYWQQPWLGVKWTVEAMPEGNEAASSGAALGVALIATAAGAEYPADTIILGRLQPDGSLGAVDRMPERLQAAAAAGAKRVIIPHLQRFESIGQKGRRDVDVLARKLGLECLSAVDLAEATELVLQRKLPASPVGEAMPRYSLGLSTMLDGKCRSILSQLAEESKSWPRTDEQRNALPAPERPLWKNVVTLYDLSVEAYRGGRLYAAYRLMRQTQSYLAGLATIKAVGDKFDYATFDDRAQKVRQQMAARLTKPAIDANELQSALLLAEEGDWLYGQTASVIGAQILARQAFAPRSEATAEQKRLAQVLLIASVVGAEQQMKEPDFLVENASLLIPKEGVSAYDRPSLWLPHLRMGQLGAAEYFISGLQSRSAEYGDKLMFDVRLGSFENVLQGYRMAWKVQQQEIASMEQIRELKPSEIGFFPGEGYSTPKPPTPVIPQRQLSETAQSLAWVNDYVELATLDEKYRRLGVSFEANTQGWRMEDRAALQNLLQVAEWNARRGMAQARSIGIDTTVLALIYESASTLRTSEDSGMMLEGLRQYWRCAMLGNLSWQLGSLPRAMAESLNETERSAGPARLLPTTTPALLRPAAVTANFPLQPPPLATGIHQ